MVAYAVSSAGLTAWTDYIPVQRVSGTNALLHFDGTNNTATFTDEIGNTWTAGGGAVIDTSQKKFGTAAFAMDAIDNHIYATSADFTIGTQDFTAEFFLRPNTPTGTRVLFDMRPNATQGLYPALYVVNTTMYYFVDSADRITAANAVADSAWRHYALVRYNSETKLYVDGTQVGSTYADTNNYLGTRIVLGSSGVTLGSLPGSGHMDEFRMTVGSALYTAAFTPPSSALVQATSGAGLYDDGGSISTVLLSSISGKTAWVDYIPVVLTSVAASGRWRSDSSGAVPISVTT